MILTPELASRMLDKRGPPRHLEARREISVNDARNFLRVLDHRHRFRVVAAETKLSPALIEHIFNRLLSNKPVTNSPDSFRQSDTRWLGR